MRRHLFFLLLTPSVFFPQMIQYTPLFNSDIETGSIEFFLQTTGYGGRSLTGNKTVEFAFFKMVV